MRKTWLLATLLFSSALFAAQNDVTLDLRNPTYTNGILHTNQGGVIRSQDLRIQARSIQYIRRTEEGKQIHRLEAEGDLLIQYKGRVYVGSELEYDFVTNTGKVFDGKTFSSMWYVGGDIIELKADGSYRVTNAYFTTCENVDSSWDLHAGRVNVLKDELLSAKKVRLRLFKIPALWLPSFKINLKKFKEPVFRYSINWDKGQGPRAMIRYQLYSWREFALYGRIEYRYRTGVSGAIETEYLPTNSKTTFVTRSYVGTDRLENAPDKQFRYRLQGAFHTESQSGRTQTALTWDKYSDVRMPNDFKSEDFEVNTAKQTLFYLHHQEHDAIMSIKARPRLNQFESIKQDLPSLFFSARPAELGKSGIMYSLVSKASYLNFAYSDQLSEHIQDFHSYRLELRPQLYRPFHLGPLIATPIVGGAGIFYSTSEQHTSRGLAALFYGGTAQTMAKRSYSRYNHVLQPYLSYYGLSRPTVSPDRHYIFTINDGYQRINQLKIGLQNSLYSLRHPRVLPSLQTDLYINAFFKDHFIPQLVPKLYFDLNWNLPALAFTTRNCWNYRNHVLDFSNSRLQWTANEHLALALELRYRSRYDWRKADHENFILDVSRSEEELLLSPISDQRMTILTSAFIRLTPFWECRLQSHHGYLRSTQNPYNEFKADLFTWISSSWKLRISYTHTIKDDRVTAGISLIKK